MVSWQAALTPEQRKDVEFSLQAILSGTLYKPTVKMPAARSFPNAERRNSANGSSVTSEVKVDDEAYQWLAHAYQLGEQTSLHLALSLCLRDKINDLMKLLLRRQSDQCCMLICILDSFQATFGSDGALIGIICCMSLLFGFLPVPCIRLILLLRPLKFLQITTRFPIRLSPLRAGPKPPSCRKWNAAPPYSTRKQAVSPTRKMFMHIPS